MDTSFFPANHAFNTDPFFTGQSGSTTGSTSRTARPDLAGQRSRAQLGDTFAESRPKHFLGHGLRNLTTGFVGLPASGVRRVAVDALVPVLGAVGSVTGAVLGCSLGLVGGGVGSVLGLLTRFAPVKGAGKGYDLVRDTTNKLVHGITDVAASIIQAILVCLEHLAYFVGWSVGAIITSPLCVFGRF